MRTTDRRGLTLVELMVALAIGSMVLLSARLLAGSVADGAVLVAAAGDAAERAATPERTLRGWLRRVEVGTDSLTTFAGAARGAAFTSWCDVPGGWQERCRVTLLLDRWREEPALIGTTSTGSLIVLPLADAAATLLYLQDARLGGQWVRMWGTSLSAPLAVLVAMPGDSLLLRIGERG